MPSLHAVAVLQQEMDPLAGRIMLVWLAVVITMVIAMWKVYAKAGQPGWAAIVPIYNLVIFLKIVGRPLWWIILMFVPLVNIIFYVIMTVDLAKSFGRGVGFAIGLILLSPIFILILGFGSAEYRGPAAAQ